MARRRDDETAAKLRAANPRRGMEPHDGYVSEFPTRDGGRVEVTRSESYIIYLDSDTSFRIDKTIGGFSYISCSSQAERDRAVSEIAGDHSVFAGMYRDSNWENQINPRASK